jgi:cellulose biosynthesis protein BcsQ
MLMQADIGKPFSAHVVVLGNEKGGTGKSTTAMHVAVALLQAGQRVASIDLDSRRRKPARLGEAGGRKARTSRALLRRARIRRAAR